jgi:predicted DNA-binding protein (MmcQ/YjbR family)
MPYDASMPKKAAAKKRLADTLTPAAAAMQRRALSYPQATEDHPWGECAFKVKKKVFLFLFHGEWKGEKLLNLTMKLPESHAAALALPFASPTGYGLGKSGWVTAKFLPGDQPPLEMLYEWLDESYRAIAPAKLVAELP